jgi:hypothetical protein
MRTSPSPVSRPPAVPRARALTFLEGLSRTELRLLGLVAALLLLAVAGPFVAQPPQYHDFADHRALAGLPFAMDVLSNLPFALWGAVGLIAMAIGRPRPDASLVAAPSLDVSQVRLAMLFFAGLIVTAGCSAWYHLQPSDASLLVDRSGMVLAFAGLLGLAASAHASPRAGSAVAWVTLLAGLFSVQLWSAGGNLLPWMVLQFGGMLLVLWLARQPRRAGALVIRWGWVMAIYALAKLLELADHPVFELTQHLVSGHSLKHAVASFAALPVFMALLARRRNAD